MIFFFDKYLFANFVALKHSFGVALTGRLAKLSTAEIWKIEVKWIMSNNVHVRDLFSHWDYYITEAWILLVTLYGHSRTSEMKRLS
ncbi:MAG: hypothetical protein J6Y87_07995 [Muribaculaceae bacterium]|nr:hypothetical protein [Muribaculaceae bacterium]